MKKIILSLHLNDALVWVILVFCFMPIANAAPQQKSVNYSSGIGSPISTSTTDSLDKGTWTISQRMEYYASKPFTDLELISNPAADSVDGSFVNYVVINYGLSDNITLGAALPYIYSNTFRAAHVNEPFLDLKVSNQGNVSGISDSNIFSLWRVLNEDKHPVSMAFLVGINSPTGATNKKNNQGGLFSASSQPGSGAWGSVGGLVLTKNWGKLLVSSNLIYTQNTQGSQRTTLGSLFDYNVAAVLELYKNKSGSIHLDGVLELNSEFVNRNKMVSIKDPNSGGNSIFAIAGLRASIHSKVSLYFGISEPLIEQYNGIQVKTKYAAIGGIDINF